MNAPASSMIGLRRRQFLRAALFIAAAPIIVRASSIMPVRQLTTNIPAWVDYELPDGLGEGLEFPLAQIKTEGEPLPYDPEFLWPAWPSIAATAVRSASNAYGSDGQPKSGSVKASWQFTR